MLKEVSSLTGKLEKNSLVRKTFRVTTGSKQPESITNQIEGSYFVLLIYLTSPFKEFSLKY